MLLSYNSVVRGPNLDMIIAPLEFYIGKILIFNSKCIHYRNLYMCSIQMSSKYILGIGLIASSLENRLVGLIQSRVKEGAQKGLNEVNFIKTYVLGHKHFFWYR